jgi:hypothetical protein
VNKKSRKQKERTNDKLRKVRDERQKREISKGTRQGNKDTK